MKIIDFRLRPPFKHFCQLGIFSPVCNEKAPQKWHGIPSPSAQKKSMDLFWEEMKGAGICGGVVIGRQIPDDSASVPNSDILELAKASAGKIVPFGSLDISKGVAATMEELEDCIAKGFKGIALEPAYALPPRKADANVLYPLYARLEQASLPVVLTMSFFQGDLDYSNPDAAQRVAKDFPKLQIVLAHACYPWIPQVFNLCLIQKNIWLLPDIYMLNPDVPGNEMYGQAMRWLNGERVLFGTAYPCYNLKQAVNDVRRFGLSDEILEKFFHGNAERLLGMPLGE